MDRWKEYQIKQLTRAKEIESAFPILRTFANNIGFQFCGIQVSRPESPSFKPFHINNFTKAWNEEYENNYSEEDPITSYCHQSMLPFLWNRKAFSKAPQMWNALRNHGMEHGWSQSYLNEENDLCCTISLARPQSEIFALELYDQYGVMHFITQHLSELFVHALPPVPAKPPPVRLSTRELEIVRLCAYGKTAWEIGQILNVAERTVNYHIKNLIVKLNACNKMSAIVKASKLGFL
ncbi:MULTISPECIES: helix-turn-helix transcriptional regulator [Pseudomonas]|uniref:LuxR family regulatory protein n=1 Tax=Pseudomonas fluorescens (strain Pf0-1) TaxID=205922 RepID=Q3K6H8_PSEPF|nr:MULTISPECIES: LuxR family transcriptional regulator [Pseudomonas]ABA76626.1 LuxR family regulatory protein [Pseudomonas fluorescens Pf0-1]MBL0796718.1 autoinducer binding domain-containing protein [Pseudomonas sp. B7]MBX8625118.1 autoinducer binding domain-containing protein [Pseudomonas glycinae]MBY9026556.1 autoinducer binding domain-containing protein [Pseudomonas fluorescens]MBY9031525.1 autoinducer binding domain-containing protein [Pseudomonas fluorescens]